MTEKTRIEVTLVLPALADARDACVERLAVLLKAREGIEEVHAADADGGSKDQICIHYDPERLSIGEVRALAQRAGVELDKRYGHLLLKSEPMHARLARTVESRARQIAGVLDAVASPAGVLRIEFDRQIAEEAALRIEVQKIGVRNIQVDKQATPANATPAKATDTCGTKDGKEHDHDHEHGGICGENTELIFAAICGGLLLIGWLLSWSSVSTWIPFGCYLAAYFFGGYFTFREAIENIRAGRFEIDFLMLVAAIGAATLGEWAEGALLLFLFRIGHALENYAMGRAKRAIEALAELAPVGLFRTDAQGACIYVNEHWQKITGLDAAASSGEGWASSLHPADRARVLAEWQAASAAGCTWPRR